MLVLINIYTVRLSYAYENLCCNHDIMIQMALATTLKEKIMLLVTMII
jgi:hypothetical protein